MNEDKTIPVSELEMPDDSVVSTLSPDDICQLLTVQIRRGLNISSWLFVIVAVGAIIMVFWSRNWTWAIAGVIMLVVFKILVMLGYDKLKLAHQISVEPRLVYWAHTRHSTLPRYFEVCLTLHTRNGRSLELSTSRRKMISIVAWLKRQNSDIRVGNYDTTPPKTNG